MRFLLFADEKNYSTILPMLKRDGIVLVDENPDVVISFGGDGTHIRSEHAYPGIPKLFLKGSNICKQCESLANDEIIKHLADGKYRIEPLMKLKMMTKEKEIVGLNDITIHNGDPRHAIRYRVFVNEKQINKEVIGDGIVVATPFGSSGYYRSITDSTFEVGIGLAFNNSTEQADHMVLKDNSIIKIEIIRGPALAYVDNRQEFVNLTDGDSVTIEKSSEIASVVRIL